MKKFSLILLLLVIFLPVLVLAEDGKKKAVYFYSETSTPSEKVEKYFQKNGIYDKYEIQKLDAHQVENFEKLNDLFEAHGIVDENKRGLPAIFFGRRFMVGDVPIVSDFSGLIEKTKADFFPDARIILNLIEEEKAELMKDRRYIAEVPFGVIASAASLDILNPFSWVVLILLFWLLIFSRSKRRMFIFGSYFSLAILISHSFLAILFYGFPGNYFWQGYISIGVTVIAIIFGIFSLKGIFLHEKKSRFLRHNKIYHLIVWWRGFKEKIANSVMTETSFFFLGLLASLFSWAYFNEPYKAIVESLKEENNLVKTIFIVLIYNILFIIPFLLVSLLAKRLSRTKKMDLFGERFFNLIKILLGVIMLFIGLYLALTLIK